ncbi:MAG: hypothetical protein HRU41_27200 [Saprospiraceae bacterium]|nr:hypothetical protein [Saprospiraceae bacterium]
MGAKTKFAPDAEWMRFCSENLPDRRQFWITDVDSVIRDRDGNLMLIERKMKNRAVPICQAVTLSALNELIIQGVEATGGKIEVEVYSKKYQIEIKYYGLKVVQCASSSYADGVLYVNGKEVSKQELIKLLSFQ